LTLVFRDVPPSVNTSSMASFVNIRTVSVEDFFFRRRYF
jgi:hypothetical protein